MTPSASGPEQKARAQISAHVRGVADDDGDDLSALGELWGRDVAVTGVVAFSTMRLYSAVEAERIERAMRKT